MYHKLLPLKGSPLHLQNIPKNYRILDLIQIAELQNSLDIRSEATSSYWYCCCVSRTLWNRMLIDCDAWNPRLSGLYVVGIYMCLYIAGTGKLKAPLRNFTITTCLVNTSIRQLPAKSIYRVLLPNHFRIFGDSLVQERKYSPLPTVKYTHIVSLS